jgi:hypothetical protein
LEAAEVEVSSQERNEMGQELLAVEQELARE